MNLNGNRLARSCAATTVLLASCATQTAFASHTHKLQHGENLSVLARRYHVSIREILDANGLSRSQAEDLRDGRRMVIPDSSQESSHASHRARHKRAEVSMRRKGVLTGDNVSVRLGPGKDYHRVTLADVGAKVTVTARHEEWAQIELPDGKSGWVLAEYVYTGRRKRNADDAQVAKHEAAQKTNAKKRFALAHRKHGNQTEAIAQHSKKHQVTQVAQHKKHHAEQVARHEKRLAAQIARHKTRYAAVVAAAAHRKQHHAEQVALHHKHRQQVAAVHHHTGHTDSRLREHSADGRGDIVRTAFAYRGTPYVYGGERRGGFDCSGFTRYLYGRRGISLPHSARGQFGMGHHVSRTELQAGDLVFFHTVTPGISHVGMYVGNGKFVHASSRRSGGVRVDSLNSGYYSSAFRGARRLKK